MNKQLYKCKMYITYNFTIKDKKYKIDYMKHKHIDHIDQMIYLAIENLVKSLYDNKKLNSIVDDLQINHIKLTFENTLVLDIDVLVESKSKKILNKITDSIYKNVFYSEFKRISFEEFDELGLASGILRRDINRKRRVKFITRCDLKEVNIEIT